jgi:hypothetical protein
MGFPAGPGAAPAAGTAYERKQPAQRARREDVWVVALFSVGSMLVLWAAGVVLALVMMDGRWVRWMAVAGVGVGVVLWFVLMLESRRLLWLAERVTGRDLDGDGHTGRPEKASKPILLRVRNRVRLWRSGKPVEVPVMVHEDIRDPNRALALDLAEFLAKGAQRGFGIRDWKEDNVLSTGTEVTDPKWRELTGYLTEAGWLKKGNRGTQLVGTLDEALKAILVGN